MQGERSEPAERGKAPPRGKPATMRERAQAPSVSAHGNPAGGGSTGTGEAAATPKQCRRPQGESAPTTRPIQINARSGRGRLNATRRTHSRRSAQANEQRAPERSALCTGGVAGFPLERAREREQAKQRPAAFRLMRLHKSYISGKPESPHQLVRGKYFSAAIACRLSGFPDVGQRGNKAANAAGLCLACSVGKYYRLYTRREVAKRASETGNACSR